MNRSRTSSVSRRSRRRTRHFRSLTLRKAGYKAICQGERTWNGVAILAKESKPVLTRHRLPSDPLNEQARYIEAAVQGVLIACLYLPNGNPYPGPKFSYKLRWFKRLIEHAALMHATGLPVVLADDYNVVPTDAYIYPTRSWSKDALLQAEAERRFMIFWTRAGRMRCGLFILAARCIHSGTISGTGGPATPACGWTTSC